MRVLKLLSLLALAAAAPAPPADPGPVVIRRADVPLYDVYAWERWGQFHQCRGGEQDRHPL